MSLQSTLFLHFSETHHVFETAQYSSGQDSKHEGQKVEGSKDPEENIQRKDLLTTLHTNKLIVIVQISSTGEKKASRQIIVMVLCAISH